MTVIVAGSGPALGQMLSQPFMRNAFLAGTFIALAAGLVGYLVVFRSQVFTGDALSHFAFAGAVAALALGVNARLGLFVVTIAGALGMGLLASRGRPDDVAIGSVFAWILGLGVLFLSLYTTSRSAGDGRAGVTVLFGSVLGLSAAQSVWAAVIGVAICLAVLAMARPLLFTSVDAAVAAARGVPVRGLGLAFLAVVGACAAEATQAVGALLLLGLLAAPGGAALRLTARPYRALWISAGLAVVAMWSGLTASYLVPRIPPSFGVIAAATVLYLVVYAVTSRRPVQG